jgi:formylglycine-generating enzyme required for sulfatase activity
LPDSEGACEGKGRQAKNPACQAGNEGPRPVIRSEYGVKMVRIEPGSFWMGSPDSEAGRDLDEVRHKVTITRPLLMSQHEVPYSLWVKVMGRGKPYGRVMKSGNGMNCPVDSVSWIDAVAFCNRLSELEDLTSSYRIEKTGVTWNRQADGYRLPTEAEWEYACRAGTDSPFSFGDCPSTDQINFGGKSFLPGCPSVAWHHRSTTVAVGRLPPNAWGLHEMHGNVYEWCWDWKSPYPREDVRDPTGPETGIVRVCRGGNKLSQGRLCRSSYRSGHTPVHKGNIGYDLGFRLCRNAPGSK